MSVLSDVIGPPVNSPMVPEQGTTGTEPSSVLDPDPEDTLVNPFGYQMESFFPEVAGELVVDFLRVPDDEEFANGDTTSCFVQDTETYVIGSESEEGDEDMDDCGEATVTMSNRQSTLSSFSGASLLASPRHSVFGESSVASPTEDSAVNFLSPVQLSAKLHPFPIPSLGSGVKRGDSIDSGYADGDSWVSPLPFPRSPPRSSRSPVTFLSHSRRASYSSPTLQDRRVSYDVGVLRPSYRNPIEVIEEVEPDDGSQENEDIAYTILDAYETSPSEKQGENEDCDPLQVVVAVVAERKAEEDDELSKIPADMRSLRRCSPEYLHPTREFDLDSCNQPSDDNLSFKTALSTQPSYEDMSKVSPVEHNTLLSSVSGCSSPGTSMFSHYSDASELLEQPPVDSHARESSHLITMTGMAGQIDNTKISEAMGPEECSLPDEVVSPRGRLSGGGFQFDKRSSISGPSTDTSHSLSLAEGTLGYVALGAGDLQEFAPEELVTPRERLSYAFDFDKHPPRSSPSADIQEFAPGNLVASREHSPVILHYDRRSPKSSPLAESSYGPFSYSDVLGHVAPGAGDFQEFTSENVVPLKCLPGVWYFDKRPPKPSSSTGSSRSPPPTKDVLGSGVPSTSDMQEFAPENVVPQEHLSGVSHFDNPSLKSAESSRNPFSSKDVLERVPRDVDGNDSKSPAPSPTVLYSRPAAEAGQSLAVENSLGSDGITESLDSESDDFTHRLSFPLPPFLSAEFVGHSTLSGDEEASVPSGAAVANLEKEVSNACTVLQYEQVQRILSGPDLTEKTVPSQLSSVGSPDFDTDFTLRRSRAASDLTVKGGSPPPVTMPGDAFCISRSPPPPLEQPGQFDSVQSLYDQYFDDGISDDSSEFPSPAHKDTTSPDVSSPAEEPSQDVHLQSVDHTSDVFRRVSSQFSDRNTRNSDADSLRSETVLRPLLTGRRSFLRSSLAELVPEANPATARESSCVHPSKLQAREIGSSMVPLGFRRHKPQVCK